MRCAGPAIGFPIDLIKFENFFSVCDVWLLKTLRLNETINKIININKEEHYYMLLLIINVNIDKVINKIININKEEN